MEKKAVAYFRTSSMTNVGEDKDSLKRQQHMVEEYARAHGYKIEFARYDAGVSGDSIVTTRDSMVELLAYCANNDVKTILVENAGRFARNKDHAIRGLYALQDAGIESLIFADKNMDFIKEWSVNELNAIMPFLEIVFAANEKRALVQKLKAARDRKKAETGKKVDGRKNYQEVDPKLVKEAKRLRRQNPISKKRRSYRNIADELYMMGFRSMKGGKLTGMQVKLICDRRNSLGS